MAVPYAELMQVCTEFQENFSVLNVKLSSVLKELQLEKEETFRCRERIKELESLEAEKDKSIANWKEECQNAMSYKTKYLESQIATETLKGKLESARRSVGDALMEHEQQVTQLKDQLEDMSKRLSTAADSTRVGELQKQIRELEERSAAQNAQLADEREACNQKLLAAHNALREQQSRNLELEQRIRGMESSETDMRSAIRRSATLQNDAALMKDRLTTEVTAAQVRLEDAQRDLNASRQQLEALRAEREEDVRVLRRAAEDDKRVLTDRIADLTANYTKVMSDLTVEKSRVADLERTVVKREDACRQECTAEVTALQKVIRVLKDEAQREQFTTQRLKEEVEASQRALQNEQEHTASLLQQQQELSIKLDAAVQQEAWAVSEKRHSEERLAALQRRADALAESSNDSERLELEVERMRMQLKFREDEVQQTQRVALQLESKQHDIEDAAAQQLSSMKRELKHLRKQLKVEEAKSDSLRRKLLRALVDREQSQFSHAAATAAPAAPAADLPYLSSAAIQGTSSFEVLDMLRSQGEKAARLNERLADLRV